MMNNDLFAQAEFEDVDINEQNFINNNTISPYSSTNSSINSIFAPMRRDGQVVIGIPTANDLFNFRNNVFGNYSFEVNKIGKKRRFLNSKEQIIGKRVSLSNNLEDSNSTGGALATYYEYENIKLFQNNLNPFSENT